MTKKLPENIQKWVDALRSGQYTQQQGTLKGPDGYCCLGVYCSINGKEPPVIHKEDGYLHEGPRELYNFCLAHITPEVYEEGVDMNDDGFTFEEIADMIEAEYKVT